MDFLLGRQAPMSRGSRILPTADNYYLGLFAQDSWRVKSNLTFNYGLRYDVNAPWKQKYNQFQTLIPGEQSVVFPGSPTGWVFPSDPARSQYAGAYAVEQFSPRLGLAYSFGDHDGVLGKILG